MIWLLPTIFVLVHGPAGDQARSYEGQSQGAITSMLADEGKTADFISQKEYVDFVDTHKAGIPPVDPVRSQAIIDAKNPLLTVPQRIDALIKAIDLK